MIFMICNCNSVVGSIKNILYREWSVIKWCKLILTHTHTHTHIYIYICQNTNFSLCFTPLKKMDHSWYMLRALCISKHLPKNSGLPLLCRGRRDEEDLGLFEMKRKKTYSQHFVFYYFELFFLFWSKLNLGSWGLFLFVGPSNK